MCVHHYSVLCSQFWLTWCIPIGIFVCNSDDQYNIPEITLCPEVGEALKRIDIVREKDVADLHPLLRRLVKDASLCFYAASHAGMYGRVRRTS